MGELDRRAAPIDCEMVAAELERNDELDLVGGVSYVAGLGSGSYRAKKFDGYVAAIREAAHQRRLIEIGNTIAERAFEQQKPDQILAYVLGEMRKLQSDNGQPADAPPILSLDELLEVETPMEKMFFDTFPVPAQGLTLMTGASKGGKTVLATQLAIAVASGKPLFDYYRVVETGPVLFVERDDPKGPAALKGQIRLAGCISGTPLYTTGAAPEGFGPAMIEWLDEKITKPSLKLVILDSYTAIRAALTGGADIVKLERAELELLDDLGKRHGCAIVLIHHGSKSAADLDWTLSPAGSFAMFAGAEALCHVSRFADADGDPERLVRIRGRHSSDLYLALRFTTETLGYEFVLDGTAATMFPLIRQLQGEFKTDPFTVKALMDATGFSKAHAYRQIDRLRRADALVRLDGNEYKLAVRV
jgi:hypothetical protein